MRRELSIVRKVTEGVGLLLVAGVLGMSMASSPSVQAAESASTIASGQAPEAAALLSELAPSYLAIMDSLADDSFTDAVTGAEALEDALLAIDAPLPQLPDLAVAAAGIRQATDISAARSEFAELSKAMIKVWHLADEKSGTVVAHCSMAGESWLQTDAPLSNPYYGSEMLRCGEVTDR